MTQIIDSLPNRLLYEEEVFGFVDADTIKESIPLGGFPQHQAVTHFLMRTESECYGLGFDAEEDMWVIIDSSDAEDVEGVTESITEWVNETYPDVDKASITPDGEVKKGQ